MVRANRRQILDRTRDFLKYLDDHDYPDISKRGDLKSYYENEFQNRWSRNDVRIPFRDVVKELKGRKELFELGDYYSFGEDSIQGLYENLSQSNEMRKTLEEWERIGQENPNFCATCGIDCSTQKNLENHKLGHRHRIHKLHQGIYHRRDQLVSCPSKMSISSDPPVNDYGLIEKPCHPGEKITMSIAVKNENPDDTLVFLRPLFLWDTGVFRLKNKNGRDVRNKYQMQPGETMEMQVKCSVPGDYGHHFVPLAFFFMWKDHEGRLVVEEQKQFFVLRFVSLHVLGDLHEDLAPTAPFQLPEMIPDEESAKIVAGKPLPDTGNNQLTSESKLHPSRIPSYLKSWVNKGLTGNNQIVNQRLKNILDCDLIADNYVRKMDTLLWIEELQMIEDIKRYDLINVTMEFNQRSRLMILDVPGLQERRPSVLRGDRVFIYMDGNRSVQYEGIVHKVELNDVHLGVHPKMEQKWIKGRKYDVRFDFSRTNLWVMHRAISMAQVAEDILFPSVQTRFPDRTEPVQLKPWFDQSLNTEQRTAVSNIVQGTSKPAPYLVFGPPGTGKTVTVTEAIRQVYHCLPSARILVCCPENTAADLVMKKLISTNLPGTVQKKDIYRMYAMSRSYVGVPAEIKDSKMFNFNHNTGEFFYPEKAELKKYRILVMTLMSSGRLVSAAFQRNYFTHVFIDEGAHAIEPECLIPIAGLMDSRVMDCGQLVVAGDPKQLGPILRSPFSLHYGLDVTLMERLMRDIAEYRHQESGLYDNRYITKLVRNYRSHDTILKVPRDLFYDQELVACGDPMILTSMLNWEHLPNKKMPIIFHAVFGVDEREGTSPSWFNRDEVAQVEKYLRLLLNEKKGGLKIKPKDIGIISPYRQQVRKLREMVRKKNFGNRDEIMLGSVEEFQGQEFKVIIISTVRSSKDMSYIDEEIKFQLGFLKNPKRFNVAITRARALLIVIGNPLTLEKDNNWKCFLDYCDGNGAFKGQHGKLLGSSARPESDNSSTSSGVLDVIYSRTEISLREQIEQPEWERRE